MDARETVSFLNTRSHLDYLLQGFFGTYSTDFAGTNPETKEANKYQLIAIDHMVNCLSKKQHEPGL